MCDLLGKTNALSKMLQGVDIDIACAVQLFSSVRDDLEESTSEEYFDNLWIQAGKLCEENGIAMISEEPSACTSASVPPPTKQKRTLPSKLQDSIVMDTTGSRPPTDRKENCRIHIFYAIMGGLVAEFNRRFAD
jgi:hypothetical protein